LLDDKELLQQLKDEKFDVAITELFDFIGIGVCEAIGLKNIVGAHSAILMEGTSLALGVPVLPSFVPGMGSYRFVELHMKYLPTRLAVFRLTLFCFLYSRDVVDRKTPTG
ncbi:hypothetical protein TELCIR_20471, partial [Teladorsagia circumcincta]